jgi:UDP-N-acetylmuramyl tripeptide synthase
MRDQLDRFGEIDHTAKLLREIALNTTQTVVINREDSRLAAIPQTTALAAEVQWFGLAPPLVAHFPQDDDLYVAAREDVEAGASPGQPPRPEAAVVLQSLLGNRATFNINGADFSAVLTLKGVYNIYNAAAALALVRAILPDVPAERLLSDLSAVRSAFGRGESFEVDGREVEMLLVKNPGGFRLALESFDPIGHDTMIAINDEYADGRDMSWLFDVEFTTLQASGVRMVSGVRAYDMALRLSYDEVPFDAVNTNLEAALAMFLAGSELPKRIYCTYTAMLRCRRYLGTRTTVERVI